MKSNFIKIIVIGFLLIGIGLSLGNITMPEKKSSIRFPISEETKDFWYRTKEVDVHLEILNNDYLKSAANKEKDEDWKVKPSSDAIDVYWHRFGSKLGSLDEKFIMKITYLDTEKINEVIEVPAEKGYSDIIEITNNKEQEFLDYDIPWAVEGTGRVWKTTVASKTPENSPYIAYIFQLKDTNVFMRCAGMSPDSKDVRTMLQCIRSFGKVEV